MSTKQLLELYRSTVAQVLGDRTPAEIAYDDAVVDGMNRGLPIDVAMSNAGQLFPTEALAMTDDNRQDLTARFEFLKEHAVLMKQLKKQRKR